MIFYQPTTVDPEKKILVDYLRKLDVANDEYKATLEIYRDNIENLKQVSENCINDAEKYR